MLRTSDQFPRPPSGSDLANTGQSESQNHRDPGECPRRDRGPCGPWDKEDAVGDRTDRDKVKGDGGGNRCADET